MNSPFSDIAFESAEESRRSSSDSIYGEETGANKSFIAGSRRLLRDSLLNSAGVAFTLLVGFLLVPIMLEGLGAESYGVWVVAATMAGWSAVIFDLGLSWSVIREVAASAGSRPGQETVRFVSAARRLYALLALTGGVLIVAAGAGIGGALELSRGTSESMHLVFAVVAAGFFMSQMFRYEFSILQGMRRFDVVNILLISSVVAVATGTVGVLALGFGLLAVLGVQTFVSIISVIVAYQAVIRIEPLYGAGREGGVWISVRSQLGFSIASLMVSLLDTALWEAAPLIIGLMLGSASVAQYHVGRKIPQSTAQLYGGAGAALFPAAAGNERHCSSVRARDALMTGIRLMVLLATPLMIAMYLLAPELLALWAGSARPMTVAIFRLIAVSTFLEAIVTSPFNVLWSQGQTRKLVLILSPITLLDVTLTLTLLGTVGVVGAAWAIVVSLLLLTVTTLHAAAQSCAVSMAGVLRRALEGIWIPTFVSILAGLLVSSAASGRSWLNLVLAAAATVLSFWILFFFHGASADEDFAIRAILGEIFGLVGDGYRGTRRALARKTGITRANYPGLAALTDVVYLPAAAFKLACDRYQRAEASDRDYARKTDPWGYAVIAFERERHRLAAGLVGDAAAERPFERVFEIGCSEGIFTELLIPRCNSLVAADFSTVALERARQRRDWGQSVLFQQWDLRRDPIPGHFDLIVAMDVLMYIRRPKALRIVIDKVIQALHPGDLLLVGNPYEGDFFRYRWGKVFMRGQWAIEAIKARSELAIVKLATTDTHVLALLRKV